MTRRRRALITGVMGQDGALLAAFLLGKGYEVHGLRRYDAINDTARIDEIKHNYMFHLHYGDLSDTGSLWRLLSQIRPDEIYNLAALSHVRASFDVPENTADVNGLGTLRLLEAIRGLNLIDTVRFYQASSSEMFGNAPAPQNETTAFAPCSPYASAKLYAYWITRNYRDSYGLHASNGILFNHESPVRGEEFVTRKITMAVAAIEAGQQERLSLGNLDARRDWGHARDYVEGMWMMLRQPQPGDYVLATGQAHSVRRFVEDAFACIGREIVWTGAGLDEKGIDRRTGKIVVDIDPRFFRPAEVHELIGDAAKAQRVLGWRPRTAFRDLVREMVDADRAALRAHYGAYDDRPMLLAAE